MVLLLTLSGPLSFNGGGAGGVHIPPPPLYVDPPHRDNGSPHPRGGQTPHNSHLNSSIPN